jgi:excisionase family DNA binding protein
MIPGGQDGTVTHEQVSMSRPSPGFDFSIGPEVLFLSVAATAQTLGISDDTVYELVNRGELPSLRIGRRRVIPRRAVELIVEHLLTDFDPTLLAARLAVERG